MIPKECGVYKITNNVTGDFYVGSSCNMQRRIYYHRLDLANNRHDNPHLQNAWNKYGEPIFEFTVLLLCDIAHKLYFEQAFLDLFQPTYNIAISAVAFMQGRHHTEEAKQKMSEARKGRVVPGEIRLKMSQAQKGKQRTKESRLKMSRAKKGALSHNFGKPMLEVIKRKISESNKGRYFSEEHKHKISESAKRCWAERKRLT